MKTKLSRKRGISTVIGGLIFVILLAAGLSVLSVALDSQKNIVDTQSVLFDMDLKKQQEDFKITATKPAADKIQVEVFNMGQNPIKINSVWVIDLDNVNKTATRFDVEYQYSQIMPGEKEDIFPPGGQTLPLGTSNNLKIKTVSSTGNIIIAALTEPGAGNELIAKLFFVPDDVRKSGTLTLGMLVTNHGDETITDVSSSTPVFNPPSLIVSTTKSPTIKDRLSPGESTLFTWHYGAAASSITGNATAFATGNVISGPISSSTVSEKLTVGFDTGFGDDALVDIDRIFKPEIFVIKPNPMGNSDPSGYTNGQNKGIWGITVANPSDQTIYVNKVTFSLFTPANLQTLFLAGGQSDKCDPQSLLPSTGSPPTAGNWKCIIDNQLVWASTGQPVIIPPYGVKTLLASVNPGGISAGNPKNLDSIVIHIAAFTSVGEFGKAGYGTGFYDNTSGGTAISNVYLLSSSGTPSDFSKIKTYHLGAKSNQEVTFRAAFVNFENDKKIRAGATLIINTPIAWENIKIIDSIGFTTPVITDVGLNYQITANTTSTIVHGGGKYITFNATAPNVSAPRLQLMTILGNGVADAGSSDTFSVAPLAEIIVQTCPGAC